MPAKTVRQLRDDRKLLGSGNTRYGLYKGKHNEKPAARPPSLLLLLRGCNNLPNGNRDRVLNQIGTLIGQNCSNLRLAGRDIIDNGETRDLYSNRVGEEFLNQADAAVLRAIEMDDLAQNVLGGDQDITELIQSHLGYDYGTFYKTPTAAVNEILGWAGKYLATLYEESQARGVPPHLDGDGPGGDDDFNDFDDGSNPDANNNNNGNTDGGSNNNNDDGNNAGFGFDPNGPWFGNPVGSHWNAANQNAANQATRISGSISICDRCTHIFSQGDCPRCSGGFGDSILSPTERWQTVLSSEAAISIIRDTLRQATQGLIQGEGLPIDMARFRPSELWRQMGPEFQAQVA
ncbi:hypothetical protein F4801DRAFT_574553 [Xylaria longipes]|nr:hypothetical protein F4801DRAFT_574553 [Xylaria longipes]